VISVILPTYLGNYKEAATGRDWKLARAIQSVLQQSYDKFQLVVVCDGCEASLEIVKQNADPRIKAILIDKQPMFSGTPRNVGIEHSTGDWVCYLDNDDFMGQGHLELIHRETTGRDWLFFNDWVLKDDNFVERTCYFRLGKCGTSNIAHRRAMRSRWDVKSTYGRDDWTFIHKLRAESDNWKKCEGQYLVCHIPYKKGFEI
jgi:glycosyltransferase involved in cell wall biosynthesis